MSKKSRDVSAVPKTVTIQRTDMSTFDDSYSFLKEKFTAEMQRIDDEMNKFSVNLMTLYGQQGPSNQPGQTSGQSTWDALANSPLIQGEGTEKMLKLQFDVSSFEPTDIRVEILEDKLVVLARHQQKTDNTEAKREFRREFIMPRGIDHTTIISSLSRDGVLTVQAPLPPLVIAPEAAKQGKEAKNVLSKNPPESKPKPVEANVKTPEDQGALNTMAPAATTGQVPQSPMSPISSASPQAPSLTSPTVITPKKTSKTPSKITKP